MKESEITYYNMDSFSIQLSYPNDCVMDFEVYSAGMQEELELCLYGSVKWDGCCNFNFGDDGYMHFCGKNDILAYIKLIEKVYELAATTIPKYDKEVAQ